MNKIFVPLTSLKKQLSTSSKPSISNLVFKLHYRATVVCLLTCVVVVCAREYLGDQINCWPSAELKEYQKVANNYCLCMGTFTVERLFNQTMVTKMEIAYLGVGTQDPSDRLITYRYYPWIPFVLFGQAVCFYLPHLIWKGKEGGRIKALVDGLQSTWLSPGVADLDCKGVKAAANAKIRKHLELIRKDIVLRLRINRTWSTWLVTMEVANLLQLLGQAWMLDKMLHGRFRQLGAAVSRGDEMLLHQMFPMMTKCTIYKYGHSGTLVGTDILCVMALNVLHQKIFVAMWFWFVILFVASVLGLCWRLFTYVCSRRFSWLNAFMLARSTHQLPAPTLAIVAKSCTYSDWLFLRYLGKNMDGMLYKELLKLLVEELSTTKVGWRDEVEIKRLI